jgi:hypothetical protein
MGHLVLKGRTQPTCQRGDTTTGTEGTVCGMDHLADTGGQGPCDRLQAQEFGRAAEKIVLRRRNICQAVAMVQWVEHLVRRKQFARGSEKIALRRRNICQAVATGAVTQHRWVEHLREEKNARDLTQNSSRRLFEEPEEDVWKSLNEDQILCGKEGFHELNQVRLAVYTCENKQPDNSPIKFLDGPRRTPLKIEQKGL